MRSTSKAHARGHFAKKYYDLRSKSFSHRRMPVFGHFSVGFQLGLRMRYEGGVGDDEGLFVL